jgi:hypothetical protein
MVPAMPVGPVAGPDVSAPRSRFVGVMLELVLSRIVLDEPAVGLRAEMADLVKSQFGQTGAPATAERGFRGSRWAP